MSKTWHETIIDVHLAVTDQVSHAEHMKADRYFVWQEDGEASSFHSDDHKLEQQIHGTIDCYTLQEYDPLLDEIQDALDKADLVGWSLLSVQYEDETKLIHYEWEFYIA